MSSSHSRLRMKADGHSAVKIENRDGKDPIRVVISQVSSPLELQKKKSIENLGQFQKEKQLTLKFQIPKALLKHNIPKHKVKIPK